jgi:hypothetical protein
MTKTHGFKGLSLSTVRIRTIDAHRHGYQHNEPVYAVYREEVIISLGIDNPPHHPAATVSVCGLG